MYGRGRRQPAEEESGSDWDSPGEDISSRMDQAPRIEVSSADDMPVRDVPKQSKASKSKPGKENQHLKPTKDSAPSSKQNTPQKEKRNDPLSSFTFSDRHGDDDEEEDSQIIPVKKNKKKSKPGKSEKKQPEQPPYDFKPALPPDARSTPEKSSRPGKDRKGQTYDPPSEYRGPSAQSEVASDWDDSEMEEQTLAQLRQGVSQEPSTPVAMTGKGNEQEGHLEKSGSSWKGLKSFGSKLSQKFKSSPRGQEASPERLVAEGGDTQHNQLDMFLTEETPMKDEKPAKIKKERKIKKVVQHVDDDEKYTYYFEETQTEYYSIQADEVDLTMDKIAEKAEGFMRRGFGEFFGVLRIVVSFPLILMLELYKFVIRRILQPVFVGLLSATGDYGLKPVFSAMYNFIFYPVFMLMYNIMVGFRTVTKPIADILHYVAQQFALVLASFRLVEVSLNRTVPDERRVVQQV